MVDAILFDFDNTLANTNSLTEIRESGRYELLTPEVLAHVRLYAPVSTILKKLRDRGVKLGLVTNSGEKYVQTLLVHLKINNIFDVVVTYGDVKLEGKKPSPKGLQLALARLGVEPDASILYIGDDNNDQLAAYRAGITPIHPTWASRRPISVAPAIEMSSDMLIDYIDNTDEYRLFAEQCAIRKSAVFERNGVYFLPLDSEGNIVPLKSEMASFCLGRYYSQKGATTAWLHDAHPLSKEIASKADQHPFVAPQHWIDLLAHVVRHSAEFAFDGQFQFDIVTVIPSKLGQDPRLEKILNRVYEAIKGDDYIPDFVEDLFFYVPDAVSQKTLARHERQYEANRALQFNPARSGAILGKRILIIDDVLTSGATLARARSLLETAGAIKAMGVSIAKTVSIIEDERPCPACHRMMRVRRNQNDGIRFWGCTGYHDEQDRCTHTEPLVKKECARCHRPMRIRTNSRTKEKFWGCSGYNQNPTCNHTEPFDLSEMPD